MAGAEAFGAIRSCLSTAAKHGIARLDAHPRRKRSSLDTRNRQIPVIASAVKADLDG